MRRITLACGLKLYVDGDCVGLNAANTSDPVPWYHLGRWEAFKQDVDAKLAQVRQAELRDFTDAQLREEVARRERERAESAALAKALRDPLDQ